MFPSNSYEQSRPFNMVYINFTFTLQSACFKDVQRTRPVVSEAAMGTLEKEFQLAIQEGSRGQL